MEKALEYYLQKAEGSKWVDITKSFESDSLIYAGIQRQNLQKGVCRVIDNSGNVLWQAKGALNQEDAHENG